VASRNWWASGMATGRASSPGRPYSSTSTAAGSRRGQLLAIGDGALGFWKALRLVYGQTRWQQYWVHETAKVLDKLTKDLYPRAKQHL